MKAGCTNKKGTSDDASDGPIEGEEFSIREGASDGYFVGRPKGKEEGCAEGKPERLCDGMPEGRGVVFW